MTTTLATPPEAPQAPVAPLVTGVLDIDAHGKGHLRAASLLPSPPIRRSHRHWCAATDCARAT